MNEALVPGTVQSTLYDLNEEESHFCDSLVALSAACLTASAGKEDAESQNLYHIGEMLRRAQYAIGYLKRTRGAEAFVVRYPRDPRIFCPHCGVVLSGYKGIRRGFCKYCGGSIRR